MLLPCVPIRLNFFVLCIYLCQRCKVALSLYHVQFGHLLQTFYKASKNRFDGDAEFKDRAQQAVVRLQVSAPSWIWNMLMFFFFLGGGRHGNTLRVIPLEIENEYVKIASYHPHTMPKKYINCREGKRDTVLLGTRFVKSAGMNLTWFTSS